MTSSLLAPKCARPVPAARAHAPGSTAPTPILDWRSREIEALQESADGAEGRAFLVATHVRIVETIQPVYAMEDRQPVSVTVARGRGSCSQRLAVLEATARSAGIAMRVRGIAADGSFWYQRFPRMRALVPDRVILAWPEFLVEDRWIEVSELYGTLDEMSLCGSGFTNALGETLFDAIGRTAIDWEGRTGVPSCDLSAVVREDLGYFDSRDELFDACGQTLAWLPRRIADPILRRRSAVQADRG